MVTVFVLRNFLSFNYTKNLLDYEKPIKYPSPIVNFTFTDALLCFHNGSKAFKPKIQV